MNLPPLILSCEADNGQLDINAEVTEGLALTIEKDLQKAFGYYQYDKVLLRINSPGGAYLGLTHILECLDYWRAEGRKIVTEVTFQAASAAALLLAHGEMGSRRAYRHSSLLYHHTRIGGAPGAITAGDADRISTALRRSDRGLLGEVLRHMAEGLGGASGLWDEGLARCALLDHQAHAVALALNKDSPGKSQPWLARITRVYQDCAARNSTDPFLRYLEQRFVQDTGMDLREAYALGLIDSVRMVPVLVPAARFRVAPMPQGPSSILQTEEAEAPCPKGRPRASSNSQAADKASSGHPSESRKPHFQQALPMYVNA